MKKDLPYRELLALELKAIQLLAEKNKLPIPKENELSGTYLLGIYAYQRRDNNTRILFKISAATCEMLDNQYRLIEALPIG